jgi:hypothetical protein
MVQESRERRNMKGRNLNLNLIRAQHAKLSPQNSKDSYEFLRESPAQVSRLAQCPLQINEELDQTLRILQLWLCVLGEYNGFYVVMTSAGPRIKYRKPTENIPEKRQIYSYCTETGALIDGGAL